MRKALPSFEHCASWNLSCAPRATRRLRFAKGLPGGSENRIKRDSFTSVAELELAIDLYVADHNARPKPLIWTASASDILA